jgi:murein L,D-transpeptidase YcbB/YkuD
MNLQHEQIFRRALQSRNPQAVLNVARIFHGMGETGKARVLMQRLQPASPYRQRFGFGVDYYVVQKKLNDLGVASPALVIDGIWGPKSKAALTTYQKSKGLSADGVPGAQTLASLGITGNEPNPALMTIPEETSPLFEKMKWPVIGALGAMALIALLA